MRKTRKRYAGTDTRRRQIIEAALACFNEMGFIDATMEDIRSRSGASHGSIYHHFKGKDQLAAAVYLEGIIDYQTGMLTALAGLEGAREGMQGIVRYHLGWVRDHPDWARYLFQMRHAGFLAETEEAIEEENRRFAEGLGEFVRRHVEDGTLRRVPREIFIALLLGPCQEYARHWLRTGNAEDLDLAVDEIAEAAWQSLRAKDKETEP